MGWDVADERRVARALSEARDALESIGRKLIGSDIVFTTLCWAVDVERRQRVLGPAPRKLKGAKIEYTRTPEEHEADFRQRMIDIAAGDSVEEVFGIYTQPNPTEIDTMESVNSMFRSCVVGKCPERDWKILHHMAKPKETARKVARAFGRSPTLIIDRKNLQCQAIWQKVKHLVSGLSSPSGTVWTVVNGESVAVDREAA